MDFSVFKDPDSLKLGLAQLLSQVCEKGMGVALLWKLTEASPDRPGLIPAFIGVSALPHLLLSFHSGRWIRRWGALSTVIWTDAMRGGLLLALGLVYANLSGPASLGAVFAASFVSNALGALFNPAVLSLPPTLRSVADNPALGARLTAWIEACFSLAAVLGPVLSVPAYALGGVGGLFAINGLSYLLAAALEASVRVAPTRAADSRPPDPRDARRRAGGDPLVTGMLGAFFVMNLFLGPVLLFLPLFARGVYGGGIASLSALEFALGLGTLLGTLALTLAPAGSRLAFWQRVGLAIGGVAVCNLAFACSRSLVPGLLALGGLGLALAMANVTILTLFQTRARPADVPGIMSRVNLVSVASLPVSMAGVAVLLPLIRVEALAPLLAGFVIALALATPFLPRIREVA